MYAAIKGKKSVDTLADVYQHSSDEGVKRAILQSYLVTGSPDKLVEAARGEQNPVLVKSAVQSLGAMGATSELATLYRRNEERGDEVSDHRRAGRCWSEGRGGSEQHRHERAGP